MSPRTDENLDDGPPPPFGVDLDTAAATHKTNKKKVLKELRAEDQRQNCCSSLSVVINYLRNQIAKQPGAFKIGIFTVFLTVMVITFLESVLSCTPILFVKFGQKAVGAIDF